MIRVLVVDDHDLVRTGITRMLADIEGLQVVGQAESGEESLLKARELKPDVVLMDVKMPEMSGLEFLNTLDTPPMIIIVSGNEKYALEAYEYDVIDYLLKPLALARFYKAVTKSQTRWQEKESISNYPEEIFIKKKNSTLVRLRYDDIMWVEALENYVTVNTFKEKFTIHFFTRCCFSP